jgi:hypothetical protein
MNLKAKFSPEYFTRVMLQLGMGMGHDFCGHVNPISACFFQNNRNFPVTGKIDRKSTR